jgi:nucleoid-associated protein YgaU
MMPIAVAALLGALVAAVAQRIMTGTAHAPVATTPSASVATAPAPVATALPASAVAPALVAYRVQPGDSLWRIAAALTGDGRNWRTLWPALDPQRPLAVGTVLEAPIR